MPPERLRRATREKPASRHHLGQRLLVGEHADAFGEVAVAFGIAGDRPAERGQGTCERPGIVERARGRRSGRGRIRGRRSGRPASARGAPRPARRPCRCSCAGRRRSATRSRQAIGSGRRSASAARKDRSAAKPRCKRAVARRPRASRIDVGQYGRAAAAPEPGEADIAGAAGEIEQRAVGARIEGGAKSLLPGAVDAERHQVVHQVVARGHAVEDGADQRLLVRAAGPAVAEIGVAAGGLSLMPACLSLTHSRV